MDLSTARQLIETYLAGNWSDTPILWENLDGAQLDTPSLQILPFSEENYLAADIEITNSINITIPAHCIRYSGLIIFSVCVKQGDGTGVAEGYGDKLISLFENKTLGTYPENLRIRNIAGSTVYRTETGFYVKLLQFSFFYNRFVSNP